MGKLARSEVRRLELRATCFRILARHTRNVVKRTRLVEWAEEEERLIAQTQLPIEPWGEPHRD